MARQYGLPLVVVRPSLVYGPGDLHLLGWFRAIKKGYYRVVARGDNLLHPIYIDDLITGLIRSAQIPAAAGRVYQLVGPRPIPIKELAGAIAQAVGRRLPRWHIPLPLAYMVAVLFESLPGLPPAALPLTRSRIAFMVESRAYCGALAQAELGFIPQIDLEIGLRRTVAWYRGEGLL
jgi:nucleoside-diphosphate-sugar epimerase